MELARKRQATILHDEAQEEAMRPLLGEIEKTVIKPDGREIHTTRNDNVERSKLIVQTLLKRAGQLAPSKYGDKLDVNHSGAIKSILVPERIATERSATDVKPEFGE
jgi:hypothetical protein